jgi:hypothetical protein
MSLVFQNQNDFLHNSCITVNTQASPPEQFIAVGPLLNTDPPGGATHQAYMKLWWSPASTAMNSSTARPIALNGQGDAMPPSGGNQTIQEFPAAQQSANWYVGLNGFLSGQVFLFAQGFTDTAPTSWKPASPINALNNVYAIVPASVPSPEHYAVLREGAHQTRPPRVPAKDEFFFAFGIIFDEPADGTRLLVRPAANIEAVLRCNATVARLAHGRDPSRPEVASVVLGRERVTPPPPELMSGHMRLQYTGEIRQEVYQRLRASENDCANELDIDRGELAQGILRIRKRSVSDLCAVDVIHERRSDGCFLGGLMVVA